MMRKLAAVAAVAVAALAVAANPAHAHPGCGANLICFFNAQSNASPIQVYSGGIARNTCYSVPSNLTSYIDNNTGTRWKVFQTSVCNDITAPVYPNSEGPMNSLWDDAIKSTVRTSMTTLAEGPLAPGVF